MHYELKKIQLSGQILIISFQFISFTKQKRLDLKETTKSVSPTLEWPAMTKYDQKTQKTPKCEYFIVLTRKKSTFSFYHQLFYITISFLVQKMSLFFFCSDSNSKTYAWWYFACLYAKNTMWLSISSNNF